MADDAIEKAYELGKEYEKVYRGCSQCVMAALQDAFGVKNDDVFKAAAREILSRKPGATQTSHRSRGRSR